MERRLRLAETGSRQRLDVVSELALGCNELVDVVSQGLAGTGHPLTNIEHHQPPRYAPDMVEGLQRATITVCGITCRQPLDLSSLGVQSWVVEGIAEVFAPAGASEL